MYELAGTLAEDLHGIEHEAVALRQRIHEIVCESGRVPVDLKAPEVLRLVAHFVGVVDFSAISERAREVTALKAEIDECELELEVVPRARRDQSVAIAV